VNTLLNRTKLLEQIQSGKDWRMITKMWEDEMANFTLRRAAALRY
jgi:hypothetical protein